MTYPWVPAYHQLGHRKGPVKAFLVHMAEGGGTVGYLSRQNPNSVSVHYVIERSGRIVQMVKEADASGSVNPKLIRISTDADGFFGYKAAKAVMGDWWSDPNSAVISVEIEGYASEGPSATQSAALIKLAVDVRGRFPSIRNLGHRDFASYKACPGKLIPWERFGGHGPVTEEEDEPVQSFTFGDDIRTGRLSVKTDRTDYAYLRLRDGTLNPASIIKDKRAFGPVRLLAGIGDNSDARSIGYVVGQEAAFLLATDVVFKTDQVDCTDVVMVELNKAADRAAIAVRAR